MSLEPGHRAASEPVTRGGNRHGFSGILEKTWFKRAGAMFTGWAKMLPGPWLGPHNYQQVCHLGWDCLLSLGFHGGFTTSYRDPEVLKNALLFMDGCQIVVSMRG